MLVIIGLLVGGVLVGQDLIKSAEIRAQISQIEEFKTAVNTFKVKYNYLPRDMPPSEASQLGFFTFTGAFAGKACIQGMGGYAYGNNDGIINARTENYPFWSHLSDAKLVKGTYGGTAGNLLVSNVTVCFWGGGIPIDSPNTNMSELAPIPNNNMYVVVQGNHPLIPESLKLYNNTQKNNIFTLYPIDLPVTSARNAYMIDSKMDDGLPTSGDVRIGDTSDWSVGAIIAAPPCTTSVTPLQYDLSPATADTKNCYAMDFLF